MPYARKSKGSRRPIRKKSSAAPKALAVKSQHKRRPATARLRLTEPFKAVLKAAERAKVPAGKNRKYVMYQSIATHPNPLVSCEPATTMDVGPGIYTLLDLADPLGVVTPGFQGRGIPLAGALSYQPTPPTGFSATPRYTYNRYARVGNIVDLTRSVVKFHICLNPLYVGAFDGSRVFFRVAIISFKKERELQNVQANWTAGKRLQSSLFIRRGAPQDPGNADYSKPPVDTPHGWESNRPDQFRDEFNPLIVTVHDEKSFYLRRDKWGTLSDTAIGSVTPSTPSVEVHPMCDTSGSARDVSLHLKCPRRLQFPKEAVSATGITQSEIRNPMNFTPLVAIFYGSMSVNEDLPQVCVMGTCDNSFRNLV